MVAGVQVGPTGMIFQLDSRGVPQPNNWPDGGAASEVPFAGDWLLTVQSWRCAWVFLFLNAHRQHTQEMKG